MRAASPRQPADPIHSTAAITAKTRLCRNMVVSCLVVSARHGPKPKLWQSGNLPQEDQPRGVGRRTRCCFPNALAWRLCLAIGSHPLTTGPAISHHIKAVKPPEAVAIRTE